MSRYVCIHGHFYQPPRENPWTGVVERQETASPWHDWNERISDQCYGPCGAARLLDEEGLISSTRNCYGSISFNVGPTLLGWLEDRRPWIYRSMLEADRIGAERFEGHGPAIAQVYGHAILPLASERDRRTQVVWGISDFVRRFRRRPEGMWLPEAAVDTESLEVLAGEGIKFALLAPHQVLRLASDAPIDISKPYICRLPSGEKISLFFYDGELAREMAFGAALEDGRRLARRLSDRCPDRNGPALEHVAVDGETFGHHHRFGEMALAACLDELDRLPDVDLTVYGRFLEICPPESEVEIVERSSWSCVHGVERWRSDCGCSDGGHPQWHQRWRAPMRGALESLQREADELFKERGSSIFSDPWAVRDRSERLYSKLSPLDRVAFLRDEAGRELSSEEESLGFSLLEMERCSMLMFSSCGWFFDDICRIEAIQVLRYAAKVLDLAERLGKPGLRKPFMDALEKAPSNVPELGDGSRIFSFFVEPASMDLPRVAAHVALYRLFDLDPGETEFPLMSVKDGTVCRCSSDGEERFFGQLTVRSELTGRSMELLTLAVWWGGRRVLCGALPITEGADPEVLLERVRLASNRDDRSVLGSIFGHRLYSLRHLFRDSRDRVVDEIKSRCEKGLAIAVRDVVLRDENLLLLDGGESVPLRSAAKIFVDYRLNRELSRDRPSYGDLIDLLGRSRRWGVQLDRERLEKAIRSRMVFLAMELERNSVDTDVVLKDMSGLLDLMDRADVKVDLWPFQKALLELKERAEKVDVRLLQRIGCSTGGATDRR
ncbi:MAG: DUF3536 domain-containing protein [Synergistota bacterium]|nr:DUF3536 domain-containing protein [Synergistota bacterium]